MVSKRGDDTMSSSESREILSLSSGAGSTTWKYMSLIGRRVRSHIGGGVSISPCIVIP